ncbi:hypothetical protein [Actinoplanes sp. NPDC023714]|uniref:hypothetical protein n=1 Tax=Actinoplanes sp. NPDC023714 TaxID=3154322 RepID=UPI0033E212F2
MLDAVDVNVAGPIRVAQALLPTLLAAPAPLSVNVSSRSPRNWPAGEGAAWLGKLLDSPAPASPRFLSFDGGDLPW